MTNIEYIERLEAIMFTWSKSRQNLFIALRNLATEAYKEKKEMVIFEHLSDLSEVSTGRTKAHVLRATQVIKVKFLSGMHDEIQSDLKNALQTESVDLFDRFWLHFSKTATRKYVFEDEKHNQQTAELHWIFAPFVHSASDFEKFRRVATKYWLKQGEMLERKTDLENDAISKLYDKAEEFLKVDKVLRTAARQETLRKISDLKKEKIDSTALEDDLKKLDSMPWNFECPAFEFIAKYRNQNLVRRKKAEPEAAK